MKLPSSNIRAESRSKLRSPSPHLPLPEMQDAETYQCTGTSKHRSAPSPAYNNGMVGALNDESGFIGCGVLPSISEGTIHLGKRSSTTLKGSSSPSGSISPSGGHKDGFSASHHHQATRISPHPLLGGSSVMSSSLSSPLSLKLGLSAAVSLRSPAEPSNGSSHGPLPTFPHHHLPGIRQQQQQRFLPSVHASSPTKFDHIQ